MNEESYGGLLEFELDLVGTNLRSARTRFVTTPTLNANNQTYQQIVTFSFVRNTGKLFMVPVYRGPTAAFVLLFSGIIWNVPVYSFQISLPLVWVCVSHQLERMSSHLNSEFVCSTTLT